MTRPLTALPDQVDAVADWVARELDGLFTGEPRRSGAFVGGQAAADAALAALDITGYAARRNQVHPSAARGASKMSPYIRYGLVPLRELYDHPAVADAPSRDRSKYRHELLWQEFTRQWYAVFGTQTRRGVVYEPPGDAEWERDPWPSEMRCIEANLHELHTDGWMVNQSRMWLASQWTVRAGAAWRDGEDEMFRHLVDGSRAANRNGWQWVVGASRNRTYGFARRQVLRRAREFCSQCELADDCPIVSYPEHRSRSMLDPVPNMSDDLLLDPAGDAPEPWDGEPEAVWLTAESLGDADPALDAHPDLPVHFVFDEPLLTGLRLDGKRLVFLAETLADLSTRRELRVWRGRPADLVEGRIDGGPGSLAVTAAPVPGFRRIVSGATIELHVESWPWLRPPTEQLLDRLGKKRFPNFSSWEKLTR